VESAGSLALDCAHGHKVGQEWTVNGKTPEGICLAAFAALLPFVVAMRLGGPLYYKNDQDVTTVACPDAANPVVFEIRKFKD